MGSVELLTAQGQLALASEFRFDYWHTKAEHDFYTVKRGRKGLDGRWCVLSGVELSGCIWWYWDGEKWNAEVRGKDAYRFDLEEALLIARRLAFEENQRIVETMERRFPGEFRGGPVDMANEGGMYDDER